MSDYIIAITTTEKKDDAEKIADFLIEKKLAACVQIIGPITSIYRWQGAVEKSEEFLCLIKSAKKHFPELEKAIKEKHPYETPEIIATPITEGSEDYLSWLRKEIK